MTDLLILMESNTKADISHLWISMPTYVHLGKRAYVSNTYHFHSEVAEKVYDLKGPLTQDKYEDEWGNDRTNQLLQDKYL